jgi:ABC-2 type transport system ATP-binding protein|tara:strand:+ start:2379 stop:3257 length:879 start_codon:yes stop_codon:yes gene_type:complete
VSNILTIDSVSKYYGKLKALNEVSFTIPENSIFAILGPNGSGKSTLIRILANLITSWEGDISYKNISIRNKENYINNFGFIVEDPSFYEYLSAKINLQILCRLTNSPFSRIEEVLSLVDLSNRKDELVSTYSYGMKQRLGIAQALLHDPKILILDEPNNGLDPVGVNQIADIIYRLSHEGKTICISTHSLNEVDRLCSDVAIMKKGSLVVAKNIRREKKVKRFFRIETFDTSLVLSKIKNFRGVSVLTAQSNSIIVSQSARSIPLPENKSFNKIKSIKSIQSESDLIEYYYA